MLLLTVLAIFLPATASVTGTGASAASVCTAWDEDVGSLLQHLPMTRLQNSSGARSPSRRSKKVMLLQRSGADHKKTQRILTAKHCVPIGVTGASLGYYALVLLASLWATAEGGQWSQWSQWSQMAQSCIWQLLMGLAAGYFAKENFRATALWTCLVSGVASLGACHAEIAHGFVAKEGAEPKLAMMIRGWTVPHALWMFFFQLAMFSTLLFKGDAGVELAWTLSLLAMLLSTYLAYVSLFLRSQTRASYWILIACSTSLLVMLTVAYAQLAGKGEPSCMEDWEGFLAVRHNPAAAIGLAAFICIMYWFHEFAPGTAIRRVAFLGILLLLLTPGMSAIIGRDLLYGPWGMFGGDNDDTKLTPFGYEVLAVAVPAALWMCASGHPDILEVGWEHRGPSATLALLRILLVYWLLVNPNWGGETPIMTWYSPDLWPGGEAMQAALALVLVCLALGIFAPLAAAVAAAAFSLGCTRFDPDCPTQHAAMVLLILAFAPCDDCFSLKSLLERFHPGWRGWSRGCNSPLWAQCFLRLQMSLLYFWAAEFKARLTWMQGKTLYHDIKILEYSPLKSVWYWIFWTEPMRQGFTMFLAWTSLALELIVPYLLWSKSAHPYAVALAALMHLSMSLLAGQLGGFSQICWITLLGSLKDKRVEDFLQDPRNFVLSVLGGIALMATIGDAFEIHGEPYGSLDPGQNMRSDGSQ
ncbi:unnamed protein product [Symbiodinium natans]|uniref:HTTM domain-containing protein n=1 Tax=Symbiodinium natans TaxID=878477 RepID=A0A812KFT3_9DINO|nr:unnamed protein product [Symbiodinium natans]